MIFISFLLVTQIYDGQTIAFESVNRSVNGLDTKIVRQGRTIKVFSNHKIIKWTPDGKNLILVHGREIVSIALHDFSKRVLVALNKEYKRKDSVDYDPISNHALVVSSGGNIYLYNRGWKRLIESTELRRLSGRALNMNLLLTGRIQPGGRAFVIGLPSDLDSDSGSAEEPLFDTFLIDSEGRACRFVGKGEPVTWIDSKHLLTNAVVVDSRRSNQVALVFTEGVQKPNILGKAQLFDARGAMAYLANAGSAGWSMQVWDWKKRQLIQTVRLQEKYIKKFAVR